MKQAKDKKLNQIIEAEELKLIDKVIQSNYECLDENCRVHLLPCSYRKENKKRPFFKLPKGHKHKEECRFSEYLKLLEEARKRRLEERELKQFPYPAILKERIELGEKRISSNLSLPSVSSAEKVQTTENYEWDNNGVSNRSVTSISQIVDFYLSCPHNRDLDLNVFGQVTPYRYWFKRIKEKNEGQYKVQRFFYGRLSMKFDCIQETDKEIVIGLYECEDWQDKKNSHRASLENPKTQRNPYKIHVSKVGLSSHKVTRLLNELNFAVKGQKEDYQAANNSEKRAYVFFLANPPKKINHYRFDVLSGFLVSRHVKIDRHDTILPD
ncbi:MAG: hypothetical protein HRT58_08160 [Crocinitomicaceae bacterium]|nr:hypothetical protein [Flavobacteriales bacterium]NQZ35622.1 hypothetical protein [Crocinitomicaceae bacterium]